MVFTNPSLVRPWRQSTEAPAASGFQITTGERIRLAYGLCGRFQTYGYPKWMVKIMENPMNKWMIWGTCTPIFGNIHIQGSSYSQPKLHTLFFRDKNPSKLPASSLIPPKRVLLNAWKMMVMKWKWSELTAFPTSFLEAPQMFSSGWCQQISRILVKLDHFPNFRDEHLKKIFVTTQKMIILCIMEWKGTTPPPCNHLVLELQICWKFFPSPQAAQCLGGTSSRETKFKVSWWALGSWERKNDWWNRKLAPRLTN